MKKEKEKMYDEASDKEQVMNEAHANCMSEIWY
jgi:hypothetical protein